MRKFTFPLSITRSVDGPKIELSIELPPTELEVSAYHLLEQFKYAKFGSAKEDASRLARYDELVKSVGPLLHRAHEETGYRCP